MASTPPWARRLESKVDKIIDHFKIPFEKNELSRVKKSKRSKSEKFCYYHEKYGAAAIKPCNGPCEFNKQKPVNQIEIIKQQILTLNNGDEMTEICDGILNYMKSTMPEFISPIMDPVVIQEKLNVQNDSIEVVPIRKLSEEKVEAIKNKAKSLNESIKKKQRKNKNIIYPYISSEQNMN